MKKQNVVITNSVQVQKSKENMQTRREQTRTSTNIRRGSGVMQKLIDC